VCLSRKNPQSGDPGSYVLYCHNLKMFFLKPVNGYTNMGLQGVSY